MKSILRIIFACFCLCFGSVSLVSQTQVAPFLTSRVQFSNASGAAPCNGCLLDTFAAGTTNTLATYSESTGTTPNSNPVVLASDGSAVVYLTNASYKFRLRTAAGVTIWTQDQISWSNLAQTLNSLTLTGNATINSSTAATSGANQSGPNFTYQGNFWNGSASAVDAFSCNDVLGTGTNPTATWTCTHSGSSGTAAATFNFPLNLPSVSVSGGVNAQSFNNVVEANALAGADACAKITAAVALLPATGGVIDARGFQGTQSCATAPVFTGSGLLIVGAVKFTLNSAASAWTVPHGWAAIGPEYRPDASGTKPGFQLQAVTGFPTSVTPMVTVGSSTPFDEGPAMINAWIDCNGIAVTGGTTSTGNEKAGFQHDVITECTGDHLTVVSGGAGSPQNFLIDWVEILTSNTNTAGHSGLVVSASGNSFGQVSNITVVGKATSKFQNGVTFDNYTGGKAFHIHVEQAVDAVTLCTGGTLCNGGSFDDITGDPGVTNSIVHIKTGTQAAHFTSVSQQGSPGTTSHTMVDDVNTLNYDDFTIPSFDASTATERTRTHYLTADKTTKSPSYDDNVTNTSTAGVYNSANNKTVVAARKADNSGDILLFATDAFNDATICGANCSIAQILAPVKLGSSGSQINNALNGTATLTYTAIAAQTSQEQTMSITNASATNFGVFCSPRATLGNANISWSAWVSSAGTVSVRVTNPTTGSVTPSAVAWGCSVFQ